jgi:hypothetical protein
MMDLGRCRFDFLLRGVPFTSAAGFGVATGPACAIGVGCVSALRGAVEAWGLFCSGGRLPVALASDFRSTGSVPVPAPVGPNPVAVFVGSPIL